MEQPFEEPHITDSDVKFDSRISNQAIPELSVMFNTKDSVGETTPKIIPWISIDGGVISRVKLYVPDHVLPRQSDMLMDNISAEFVPEGIEMLNLDVEMFRTPDEPAMK